MSWRPPRSQRQRTGRYSWFWSGLYCFIQTRLIRSSSTSPQRQGPCPSCSVASLRHRVSTRETREGPGRLCAHLLEDALPPVTPGQIPSQHGMSTTVVLDGETPPRCHGALPLKRTVEEFENCKRLVKVLERLESASCNASILCVCGPQYTNSMYCIFCASYR